MEQMLIVRPGERWPVGARDAALNMGLGEQLAREAEAIWFFDHPDSINLLTPVEGVLEVIAALRPELRVGVITNGTEHIQRSKYDSLKLHERVSVFLTSDRAGCFKPDPRIFEIALHEAQVEAHEAVFIGDTFDTDVKGALGVGMHAVWFNPGGLTLETDLPSSHHDLRSYAGFASLLESLDRA
jgi:putative hydrolase of the HAD superfamily